jgi:hypothetical protein
MYRTSIPSFLSSLATATTATTTTMKFVADAFLIVLHEVFAKGERIRWPRKGQNGKRPRQVSWWCWW